MTPIDKYFDIVLECLKKIKTNEKENIKKAADIIAKNIEEGKLIHVIGTGGHSHMGAEELFYRAGGLVPINPIIDSGLSLRDGAIRSTLIERTPGYVKTLLEYYGVKGGDVIIVVNAYGINSATIDAALESKKLGATVIAVTSPEFSKTIPPDHPARHPTKKNLYEVADMTINCYMPFGDAVVKIEGFPQKVAPVSTIVNSFTLNCLVAQVVENLVKRSIKPPVWMSANIPGGDEANRKWIKKYLRVIKHL
jgi:uncharacterized phosphosugar-binding protein